MGLNPGGKRKIHTTPSSAHAGLPKTGPNHPLDSKAPHLRLVSLWTQFKDTGQALRPEKQSQRQGPRFSVLRWILTNGPLQGNRKAELSPRFPELNLEIYLLARGMVCLLYLLGPWIKPPSYPQTP